MVETDLVTEYSQAPITPQPDRGNERWNIITSVRNVVEVAVFAIPTVFTYGVEHDFKWAAVGGAGIGLITAAAVLGVTELPVFDVQRTNEGAALIGTTLSGVALGLLARCSKLAFLGD